MNSCKKCMSNLNGQLHLSVALIFIFVTIGTAFIALGVVSSSYDEGQCNITQILDVECNSQCSAGNCNYAMRSHVNVSIHNTTQEALIICFDRQPMCVNCINDYHVGDTVSCYRTNDGILIGNIRTMSKSYIIMGSVVISFAPLVITCLLVFRRRNDEYVTIG